MFARVFPVMLFAMMLARFAGVGSGLMTLAREHGSAKWQRSQAKRNDDCPN
jgi:hypothetical protein